MYLKYLRKQTDSDLMSIRDELRILKEVVFNLQSLDANLKKKKRGFAAGTRKELRYMFTFQKNSLAKVEQVLRERADYRLKTVRKWKDKKRAARGDK
jgi:hypothetical protein